MADSIQLNLSVTHTDQELQKTVRLMDESVAHEPTSYESGEINLVGGTTDKEIATDVNLCILKADGDITVKIGDTTDPAHTLMKAFVYDGAATKIFISNTGVDAIKVRYASAVV